MKLIQQKLLRIGVPMICLLACLLLEMVWLTPAVHADLPPRPSRPSPGQQEEREQEPSEGEIILTVSPATTGLWTVVQWQDDLGGWHDVEGWRGGVMNGRLVWWVEEKDFGKGPYRWLVYAGEGGALLATSPDFTLPSPSQLEVAVIVSLGGP